MMSIQRASYCLAIALCLSSLISGQSSLITSAAIKPHVVKLADDRLEGRNGGYDGERKAAEYVADQFKRAGLKPAGTRGYFQEFQFQPYHPTTPWQVMTSRNILGMIEGADPTKKHEIVVIGAHYDGQGRSGQSDPTRQTPADNKDDIWNSANDNAASVAALIEIARALKITKPKRTVLFIAFGAEEHGMNGSIYYVNHPIVQLVDHVAMLNLEKLGRSPERPFTIAGTMSSKIWPALIGSAAKAVAVSVVQSPIAFPDSDHYPFGSAGIPSVMIYVSSNADDAHFPSDTADKIDFERVASAARLTFEMINDLANRSDRPEFIRSPMLDPGLIAHLITDAEADAAGVPTNEGGLKVTGVIAGLPADKAGLREGDMIVTIGTRKFARNEPISVLMAGFQDLLQGKMGISIPLKFVRNKQTIDTTLNLRP